MPADHAPDRRPADLALRAGGLALLVLAALAVRALMRLHAPGPALPANPLAFALAVAAFPAASGGATLLALGHHIFDPVTVRSRWL